MGFQQPDRQAALALGAELAGACINHELRPRRRRPGSHVVARERLAIDIMGSDRDRTDRQRGELVGQWFPRLARVLRPPHTAVHRAYIDDLIVEGMDSNRLDRPRLGEWRDVGEAALTDDFRRSLFHPFRKAAELDGGERV